MLSRYSDFTRLGQGGMGVVYRATDKELHRPVALKFVTARFGSEDQARARFLREARMASPDGRYLAFEEYTPESNAWMLENF